MKHNILILLLAFLTGVFIPTAHAADIAPQSCDAQYWRQLSSRAWLEAEREIMQNQNLIFKPDSVLEYSCFDKALSVNAWPGGEIFVHTKYFGVEIIKRGDELHSMEHALNNVVYKALKKYLEANFEQQSYLGGRSDLMGMDSALYEPEDPLKERPYECDVMSRVWKTAKCGNFIHNSEFELSDGFYPFEPLLGHNGPNIGGYSDAIIDTRKYPDHLKCEGGPIDAGWEGKGWVDNAYRARNTKADGTDYLYKHKEPLELIFIEVTEKLTPGLCMAPIMTGVQVVTKDGVSHNDGVCSNPGCTYTKGGCI